MKFVRSITTSQVLLFAAIATLTIALGFAIGLLVRAQRLVFSDYLDTYLTIHRFRTTLAENVVHAERYVRARTDDDRMQFKSQIPLIRELHREIETSSTTQLEDYFQDRAIGFGLLAYLRSVQRAVSQADAAEEGAYVTLVGATRIAHYVDSYAEKLLQVRLDVGGADLAQLNRRASMVTTASAGAILLLVSAMIVFAAVFARTVTRPIVALARTAHAIAEGDLDPPRIDVKSRNEVAMLAEAFSTMQRNIKQLIEDLEGKRELEVRASRLSESLRVAQLKGLQAQINPHFLFNTLNTISRTSMFEGAKVTTELIQSLAKVFRYMLQDPAVTVSLRDELRIVGEYVRLQKQRFHERLEFHLECTINPDAVQIPALTLQPLVENAVRHGIEPSERGGMISVTCARINGDVRIQVTDTGIGMEPAEPSTSESLSRSGIGLDNVRSRLQLLHGPRLRFLIDTTPGTGTVVTIQFPDATE